MSQKVKVAKPAGKASKAIANIQRKKKAGQVTRESRSKMNFLNSVEGGMLSKKESHTLKGRGSVQAKLKVGAPDDKYEKEADAMADRVMRSPMSDSVTPSSNGIESIQRKCAECESKEEQSDTDMAIQRKEMASDTGGINPDISKKSLRDNITVQRKMNDNGTLREPQGAGLKIPSGTLRHSKGAVQRKEEDEEIQRYTNSDRGRGPPMGNFSSKLNQSKGSGQPMDSATNSFMSSRFGTDFSNVKIHTGSEATSMSNSINAKAFTHQNHIYFNQGQYQPNTHEGKTLIAHELTHTIQQGAVSNQLQRKCSACQEDDSISERGPPGAIQRKLNRRENSTISTDNKKVSENLSITATNHIQRQELKPEGEDPEFTPEEAEAYQQIQDEVTGVSGEEAIGGDCWDIVTPVNEWLKNAGRSQAIALGTSSGQLNAGAGEIEGNASQDDSFFDTLLEFAPSALLGPLALLGNGAMWIFEQLPDSVKEEIINDAIDNALWLSSLIPEVNFTDKYAKVTFAAFLTELKDQPYETKIGILRKVMNIVTGKDIVFFFGMAKGLVAGFFADGILGLIQMVIDIICLIPQFFNFMDLIMEFIGEVPETIRETIESMQELQDAIDEAMANAMDDIMLLLSDPNKLFELINGIDEQISAFAEKIGQEGAKALLSVYQMPAHDMGFIIGRVLGMIIWEIVFSIIGAIATAYFAGAGAGATAATSAGKVVIRVIAKMIKTITKMIRPILKFIITKLDDFIGFVKGMAKLLPGRMGTAGKKLEKFMEKLKELFQEFMDMIKRKQRRDRRDGGDDDDSGDSMKWLAFKTEIKTLPAKYGKDGVSKMALNRKVEQIKDRYNKPTHKIIASHDIDGDDGKWIIQARKKGHVTNTNITDVWIDRDERWRKGKAAIILELADIRDSNRNKVGIERELIGYENRFGYSSLRVVKDNAENDFNIMGSMSPEDEITEVAAEGEGNWGEYKRLMKLKIDPYKATITDEGISQSKVKGKLEEFRNEIKTAKPEMREIAGGIATNSQVDGKPNYFETEVRKLISPENPESKPPMKDEFLKTVDTRRTPLNADLKEFARLLTPANKTDAHITAEVEQLRVKYEFPRDKIKVEIDKGSGGRTIKWELQTKGSRAGFVTQVTIAGAEFGSDLNPALFKRSDGTAWPKPASSDGKSGGTNQSKDRYVPLYLGPRVPVGYVIPQKDLKRAHGDDTFKNGLYTGWKSDSRIDQGWLTQWDNDGRPILKFTAHGIGQTLPYGVGGSYGVTLPYRIFTGKTFSMTRDRGTLGGGEWNEPVKSFGFSPSGEKRDGDHVIEMQLDGPNEKKNMWQLGESHNRSGGSSIKGMKFIDPLTGDMHRMSELKAKANPAWPVHFKIVDISPKLKVGAPDDKYEKEADQMADRVMRSPAEDDRVMRSPAEEETVQRKCSQCEQEDQVQRKLLNGGLRLSKPGLTQRIMRKTWEKAEAYNPYASVSSDKEEETVQRKCTSCSAKEEDKVQRKADRHGGMAVTDSFSRGLSSTKGAGKPMDRGTKSFMENRFGSDFGNVRIHTGSRATSLNNQIKARAFTHSNDIYFNQGQYSPGTNSGKHLLAHELTHTIQQGAAKTKNIQREAPWDIANDERELKPDKVPKSLNYELVNHRLIAHNATVSDLDQIVSVIDILNLYFKVAIDKPKIRKELKQVIDASKNKTADLDITPFLPESVQKYFRNLEKWYQEWRDYIKKNGTFEDIFKIPNLKPAEKDKKVKEYHKNSPKAIKEFPAVCHNFVMLLTGGNKEGITPGFSKDNYDHQVERNGDEATEFYHDSFIGKGAYKKVRASEVQIGDIAVFTANAATRKKHPGLRKNGIVHSAVVIRVNGSDIEVLEKKDPRSPVATRTVKQILREYRKDGAYVRYLAPALAGMTAEKDIKTGKTNPTESFTIQKGPAREDTYVLFKVNTDYSRVHEDKKLMRFIAQNQAGPIEFKVHGYASVDGDEKLNLNLSAHRAIAVKKALLMHLPKGSGAEAVAHGETDVFGKLEENRRAGIELKKKSSPKSKPAGQGTAPKQKAPSESTPVKKKKAPKAAPGNQQKSPPVKPKQSSPGSTSSTPVGITPITPVNGNGSQVDSLFNTPTSYELNFYPGPDIPSLTEPFVMRGIYLSPDEFDQILENRANGIEFLRQRLEMNVFDANKLIDILLPIGYDIQLGIEHPTQEEQLIMDGHIPSRPLMLQYDLMDLFIEDDPADSYESPIQRKKSVSTPDKPMKNSGFNKTLNESRGNGKPLNKGLRGFMENRFGADFGQVKIHQGGQANEMAKSINAEAFTSGRDIYFSGKHNNLESQKGKHLLAHELTHVLQQGGINSMIQRRGPAVRPNVRRTVRIPVRVRRKVGRRKGQVDGENGPLVNRPIHERYQAPKRFDNSLHARLWRSSKRISEQRMKMDLERPVATLTRGGKPKDFVTRSKTRRKYQYAANTTSGTIYYNPRSYHVIDHIHYTLGRINSVSQLMEAYLKFIPGALHKAGSIQRAKGANGLLNTGRTTWMPRFNIRQPIAFVPNMPTFPAHFDPAGLARMKAFVEAATKRAAKVPVLKQSSLLEEILNTSEEETLRRSGRRKRRGKCKSTKMNRLGGSFYTRRHDTYAHHVTRSPDEIQYTTPEGVSYRYDGYNVADEKRVYEVKTRHEWASDNRMPYATYLPWMLERAMAMDYQRYRGLYVANRCGLKFSYAFDNCDVALAMMAHWSNIPPVRFVPYPGEPNLPCPE